jgi:Tol biopolymer transport system component
MELLEGETLRERLNRGPLPVRKTVEIALQIAHGLAAAHDRGIVHRDLKPENIFITRDGHTKLLDFGLAKANAVATAAKTSANMSDFTMQTVQTLQTEPGVVMGTAPYMAPEQVRGEPVDHRADIFSFGAVLYEMLSGKPAFAGDTAVEIMTGILKTEPPELDLDQLKISPALDRIVRHCLEKKPADRFQSARDLTFALGALSGSESASALRAQTAPRHKVPLWTLLVAGLVVLALAAVALHFFLRAPQAPRMDFAIPVEGELGHIALSPDGRMLAYIAVDETSGDGMLYIQAVGSPSATKVNETRGATYPFWSPNGDYVAFFAHNKLKKVSVNGGLPQVLTTVQEARGGSWNQKGVIIYSPDSSGPLWRIDADGTDPAPLTDKTFSAECSSHRWPVFLPDGDHFLFWSGDFNEHAHDTKSGIHISSLSDASQKHLLVLAMSTPGFARNRMFYIDDKGSLVAVPVDAGKAKITGKPVIIANQVGHHPSTYWGAFSVAWNGTVIYHQRTGSSLSQLTWYDRSGKELGRVGEPGLLANPRISPDGDRISVDIADPKERNIDVWIDDLRRGSSTRFTFDPAEETTAVWSSDGKEIAYRWAGAKEVLRLKNSNGFEADRGIASGPPGSSDLLPNSFSPDNQQLLSTAQVDTGGLNLALVSLADKKVVPFLPGRSNKADGQISPDGKWVAYESDETGEWQVYISPFPGGGGKIQVSRSGGYDPRWRHDGKEIFFLDPKGFLVAATVDSVNSLSTGTATQLFQTHTRSAVSSSDVFSYDVSPDGQRFLVDRYVKPAETPPLSIILNSINGNE